jgi:hypothetical protein
MDQSQFAKPDVVPCDGASHLFDMNTRPFVLKHNMAGHPLFTLDRLAQLATFLRAAGYKESVLHRDSAIVPHTMGAWDKLGDFDAVADAIRTCGTTGAWISLHDSEFDPEYREFLHDTVHSLSRIVGRDLLAEAAYATGHIFIGSPNSITDFHFDSETNFLFIMSGEKHFHIFDGEDPSVLSQRTIEDFYWGRSSAVRYDPAVGDRATSYHLAPGDCLHSPVNFPHWVQNGPAPCVALSVLLYLPENVDRAHAFQANWLWRRLGFRPSPIYRNDDAATRKRGWMFRALARKHPVNKRDVIASGRTRLTAPLRSAKRLLSALKRRRVAD